VIKSLKTFFPFFFPLRQIFSTQGRKFIAYFHQPEENIFLWKVFYSPMARHYSKGNELTSIRREKCILFFIFAKVSQIIFF